MHGKRTAAVGDNPNGRSAGAYLATQALRKAPFAVKRQVFQAFDLQIAYDAVEHRAEISATVTEAVPEARDNAQALLAEGSSVVVTDIAGAGFEPATSG